MSRPIPAARSLTALALLGAMAACGGSDSTGPGKQTTFTVAEATTVATSIMTEVIKALGSAGFGANAAPTSARAAVASVPISSSGNFSGNCTNGGSVTGTYNYTADFDNQGGGSETGAVTSTLNGCKVSTGTRVISVGGQLSWSFNATFSQNAALNSYSWHNTGSFTWDGGSCSTDYTVSYVGTGAYNISGTFCGVNVSSGTK